MGSVTFKLPSTMQILRLWAGMDGFVPAFANWEVTPQNQVTFPEEITFKLAKGATVGGFVVDEKGAPIARAKVEVSVGRPDFDSNNESGLPRINPTLAYGEGARTTDAHGHWSLNNAPSEEDALFQIRLDHPDFVADSRWGESYQTAQKVTTGQLRAQTARLVMARGISVHGTVTDPTGQPIEKAVVIRGDDPYRDDDAQRDEVRTDAAGRYRFAPRLPGKITLTVVAPGWSPEQVETVMAPANEPVKFQLKRGHTVRIQFVDEAGHPIPEVGVGLGTWRGKRALYNMQHPNVMETQIPNQADKNGVYEWTWAPEDIVKYMFGKVGCQAVENRPLAPGEHKIEMTK
jgi:protocatechuate 3,4-dioxygenase beta subunit